MEKDMDGPVIGIDLGTTHSCVAVWRNNGVEIIPNQLGKRTTPSCVAFTDKERLIGEAALNQATINPKNTISDIKRLIGRRFTDPFVQANIAMQPYKIIEGPNDKPMISFQYKGKEKQLAPEQISSMVISKMKECAEAYLETTVMSAVITVPSYFNGSQRQATKDAGHITGLKKIRIICESTAAAIAYSVDKMKGFSRMKNVLIFDLGSGTLDVSLIIIKEGVFEVAAVAGDTHLGGDDFDNRMIDYFVQEFKMKHQIDISSNPRAMRKLRTACEKAKRDFTTNAKTHIQIDNLYGDIDFVSIVKREKFDELNIDLFKICIHHVENCIKDAKIDKEDIHDIVLAGGSTRTPAMQRLLQDFFNGKELCKSINPDEAVAYGAAVLAATLVCIPNNTLQKLTLSEVNPLSMGIDNGGNWTIILIPRNASIPSRKKMKFISSEDNQSSMQIKVLVGESTKVTENTLLGEFTFCGLPSAPKGAVQISVWFDIDADGILDVIVQEVHLRSNNNVVVTNHGRLSKEEIQKMDSEAENFKLEDEKYKKMAISRNALEDYLYEVQKIIEDEKNTLKLSSEDKKKIEHVITRETEWLEEGNPLVDADQFEEKMKKLEKLLNPVISNFNRSGSSSLMPMIDEIEWQEYIKPLTQAENHGSEPPIEHNNSLFTKITNIFVKFQRGVSN